MELTGDRIEKIVYIKPRFVDVYIKKWDKPIEYFLDKDDIFTPHAYVMKNGVMEGTFWKNRYTVFGNNQIRTMLKYLEENNLWTEKKGNTFTYISRDTLQNNTSKTASKRANNTSKAAPKPSNSTRRSSIYNKNERRLPLGWHRISERGKSWFQGPHNNERYNNINYYTNKTYKVKEGNDTFYILPDGTLSWHPYKVPAA